MTTDDDVRPATMAHALRASARTFGDRPALRAGSTVLTWQEVDQQVDRACAALRSGGVGHGDRVAIMLGTTPSFVVAALGVLRAGAVMVPINTGLTAPEIAHQLTDCQAAAMVVGRAYLDPVTSLRGTLPALTTVFVADTRLDQGDDTGLVSWEHALAAVSGVAEVDAVDGELPEVDPDDLALLAYTSGTTGAPKAAMLSHRNLLSNQDQLIESGSGLTADDVVLTALPLFHSYALNVALGMCLRAGAVLELMERFEPSSALRTAVTRKATVLVGAPPMYVAWLNTPGADEADLSSVRLATSGAAPLPPKVLRRCLDELSLDVREGYGMAEAGPVVTESVSLARAVPGSVGRPLPGAEVRIMDDDEPALPGDVGIVHVRGPGVFAGYYNAPAETAQVLDPEGWLDTGDIGYLDDEGLLHLVDRAKDVIIVSGFNVYPHEVELALTSHPAVQQAVVIGVPHPYTGESVKGIVVRSPDSLVTADELLEHCGRHVARFKRPYTIEFVDALPTSPTGKVRRRLLRDDHG